MDRIMLIAQQISKQGKVPNIALIKARLPKNVPLPVIIEGLKMWQKNPQKEINKAIEVILEDVTQAQQQGDLDALLETKLEQALAPLREEIKALKIALAQLQALNTEDKN